MIAVMGLAVALCVSVVAGIGVLARIARTQTEVDAMALDAADMASGRLPGVPCESAVERARAVGAQLLGCDIEEREARVAVRVSMGVLTIDIRAHAGPPRRRL